MADRPIAVGAGRRRRRSRLPAAEGAGWLDPSAQRLRSQAVLLLQIYAVVLLVLPSDAVISAVGAAGYAGSLVAMGCFGLWCVSTMLGFYDSQARWNPIRLGIIGLWLVSLASYGLMNLAEATPAETLGADRWLMQLAGVTGVAFLAADWLGSLAEVKRVLRALVWGGSVCGVVAAIQFWVGTDLAVYLRMLPGFALNADNVGVSSRAALNRVTGTAIHPIELGVVAGMLLPLAIYLALYDRDKPEWRRWLPVVLTGLAIPASVSRSAIVAIALAVGLFVILLPARQRVFAIAFGGVAVVGVFMAAPGLISTLTSFFTAGKSDLSVASRVDDYPTVERLVSEAPWFGRGGGAFLPENALEILDNQYLKSAVELGLVGLVVLFALYFLYPAITAALARRSTEHPELRDLAAALLGSAAAGVACSFTFDSLSFPMFVGVHALVVGLIGTCWRLGHAEDRPDGTTSRAAQELSPPQDREGLFSCS